MSIIKNIGPWLLVIGLACVVIDTTLQHSKIIHDKETLQQQIDSLEAEVDSLNMAVETREQVNNTLIQLIK